MADIVTTTPEAAYVTKPNILVPKEVGAAGKARIEALGNAELVAYMGQDTVGRKAPVKNVTVTVPALTTVQET